MAVGIALAVGEIIKVGKFSAGARSGFLKNQSWRFGTVALRRKISRIDGVGEPVPTCPMRNVNLMPGVARCTSISVSFAHDEAGKLNRVRGECGRISEPVKDVMLASGTGSALRCREICS